MPYIVTIRPTATTELEIPETSDLDHFNAAVFDAIPTGHDLVEADYRRAVAIIRERAFDKVTIADRNELDGCVPDGWQAVNIRPA